MKRPSNGFSASGFGTIEARNRREFPPPFVFFALVVVTKFGPPCLCASVVKVVKRPR
jgi:hypothetical protein